MQWKILTGKLEVNKGMLMENAVAQMLRAAGQELFYHFNSGQGGAEDRMEIEFLLAKTRISARHNIYPVEVKSANDYTTASMDKFCRKFTSAVARPVVLHPGDADFSGETVRLPLYMAMLIPGSGL